MEGVNFKDFTLTLSDIQGPSEFPKDSLQLHLSFNEHQHSLSVGSCIEIQPCEAKLTLKRGNEVLGQTIADLDESTHAWVPLPPSFQLKLIASVTAHPRKLKVQTGPPPVSKCGYVKKLQQIEQSEKDIQGKMTEAYFSTPAQYQEVMGKNVSISPGKGFFRKRTLDTSSAPMVPDYSFSGHFEVSISNISATEEDILQNLALGLLTRKKDLDFQLEEIILHQEVLTNFDSFIKDLGESMDETRKQTEQEAGKMSETLFKINEEVKEIENLTESTEEKIQVLQNEICQLREACDELKSKGQNEEDGGKGKVVATKDLRKALDKSQKEILVLEGEYEKVTGKYLQDYPEKDYASVVNQKILSLAELQRMVNLRDMELQESIRLQSEVSLLEAQLEINSNLNEVTGLAAKQESDFKAAVKNTNEEFLKLSEERERNIERTSKGLDDINQSLLPIESKIRDRDDHSSKNQEALKLLQDQLEKIDQVKKNIISSTPGKASREEFFHNFEKTMNVDGKIIRNLGQELEFISNLLLKNASSSLNAQRVFRYVEDQIESQGLQHKSMLSMISSLKEKNPAYIPVKTDPIDVALGKYLNTHNNLEIKFTRIDKQLYNFGSIKVEIVLEDGQVWVVVDGNKNGIEEFVSLYTALEKGKIRRSPSKVGDSPGKRASKTGISSISK